MRWGKGKGRRKEEGVGTGRGKCATWAYGVDAPANVFVCLLLNGTSALFRPLKPRIVEVEHMRLIDCFTAHQHR